jgi:NADH-quinone oxidoreductase subunit C
MITQQQIAALLSEYVPGLREGTNKQYPEIIVDADQILVLADRLKQEPATRMDYLFCLTAADRKDGLNVVYHLASTTLSHSLMVRVILADKVNPSVPSVSSIWKAAEFYEREVFDLFGIRFNDHPDMRRIFLEDDWVGYPLRKDYKDGFILEH